MAINKKLIHFNKKTTFNSQKLSANASNTQYQVGGTGTVQTGAPDINYQSIVYIKDSKEIWTHGQFYGSVAWSAITGKPSFATVATSGNYNDLSNKPTIPTATSSVLGGVKIGNGLNINSGVLSVTAPQVDNHTVYNLVGYKSGINPLKNTPQLTFKSSEISGSKSGTLTIGDDPESGPSWVGALNLEYSERSNLASVYTESPLSITSSLGDLGIYASDAGGGGKLTLSTASSIHLINSNDNFATVQLEPRSDPNGYSYLSFICGPSANAGSTVLELGGADDQAIFSGSVSASGGFFDTSDTRVKTNVVEIDASKADAVRLVEFDRTDKKHHGYGVIAQELEKVYPEMVNTDDEGFKSVNYNELAMVKIKYLEDKVARLEALVGRLLAE